LVLRFSTSLREIKLYISQGMCTGKGGASSLILQGNLSRQGIHSLHRKSLAVDLFEGGFAHGRTYSEAVGRKILQVRNALLLLLCAAHSCRGDKGAHAATVAGRRRYDREYCASLPTLQRPQRRHDRRRIPQNILTGVRASNKGCRLG